MLVGNSNLDSQTKEIYRKNIQIRDALEMHTEDAERLKKVKKFYHKMIVYSCRTVERSDVNGE